MRVDLLSSPQLIAVGCFIESDQIRAGILVSNLGNLPDETITLYDATTEPPTSYPVTIPDDCPQYRAILPRISHAAPV